MAKPFPLQILLNLAHSDSDSAAARLGALNGHDRDMEERLELLLAYRDEYTVNLARMASAGMSNVDWRNFRAFIEQQREAVADAKRKLEHGQLHWHAQQRKVKSFDTLCARHRSAELQRESLQEQKVQDEFSLRSFLGRRAVTG